MSLTDVLIIGALMAIGVSDVLLLVVKRRTYSNRLRVHGQDWAAPCYAWGVLAGHFWGPAGVEPVGGTLAVSIPLLVASAVVVAIAHRVIMGENDHVPRWFVLAYVPIGILPGAFLWPQ